MKEEKPRILIVDDETDHVEFLCNFLSKRNFLVFSAESGEDALLSIKENAPDLVFLDLKLKGTMDGRAVLTRLREYDKQTKIAIVTGTALEEYEAEELSSLGAVELLIKPVQLTTLENLIKKVLQKSYPGSVRLKEIKSNQVFADASLRRISHDISNVTGEIFNKCEGYVLNAEEGFYKDDKESLEEAVKTIQSVYKAAERLTELVNALSSAAKK